MGTTVGSVPLDPQKRKTVSVGSLVMFYYSVAVVADPTR